MQATNTVACLLQYRLDETPDYLHSWPMCHGGAPINRPFVTQMPLI